MTWQIENIVTNFRMKFYSEEVCQSRLLTKKVKRLRNPEQLFFDHELSGHPVVSMAEHTGRVAQPLVSC